MRSFSYDPEIGNPPLEVQFTDTTSGMGLVESRLWDFGDGNTSTEEDPVHTYDLLRANYIWRHRVRERA